MALTTQSATIGGATKTLIVAADGSSNIAAAHVTVDSSGAEKGVTGNPLAVSAAALPLPTGAATAALQPALNGDGGALAHVTNFPATQPVSGTVAVTGTFWQATQPVSLTALPALAAGANAIGSVSVSNLPATQAVSIATMPTTPVSGTFWQATQPVSGTVTANAGTGTMAVSAAALPLPSGAATAAKQPALGTAGTPSADVLSIQGVASGTALIVSGGAAAGAAPVNPPVSVAGIDGAGNKQHLLVDTTGRQLVVQAGGTGTDYSANTASAITAAQATTLLVTIPATATRAYVEVQNQSAATVSVVRDDGAGANQTLILLAPGSGAGQQGGGWSSATFKGRLLIYGASGAQVAAYQE